MTDPRDRIVEAAKRMMTRADGGLIGEEFETGSPTDVVVLEASVNNVCELRDALQDMFGVTRHGRA